MNDVFIMTTINRELFVVCKYHSSNRNACMHSRRIRICLPYSSL